VSWDYQATYTKARTIRTHERRDLQNRRRALFEVPFEFHSKRNKLRSRAKEVVDAAESTC